MKKIAIEKARTRLEAAKAALARLEAAETYEQFSAAWTDFLVHNNTVYTVLAKGARNSPQSQQWYFVAEKAARKDALLCYLIQARNADEHGIEPITEYVPGELSIGIPPSARRPDGSIYISHIRMESKGGQIRIETDHPDLPVNYQPPAARLVTVVDDRFGTSFPPPNEHFGQPVTDQSPLAIARLGYAYAEKIINDAERFL